MAVNIKKGLGIGIAAPLGHFRQWHALAYQMSNMRVSKIVQANIRKSCGGKEGLIRSV